jgi:ferredoxin--NADP+ reductase
VETEPAGIHLNAALGSESRPVRVAVIGSGPAGYYACEELLKQAEPRVQVDLIDRLPTPYGLVRGGVAPDHQKIKSVIKIYERTSARPGFRFLGNVSYGRDLSLDDLLAHYHQVLFCTGAETDRRMGIPGEDLPGSHPATQFVGWYNGHPDYTGFRFDLSGPRAAVVGNGNVAMDVVRILATPVEELAKTDIADYALEALRASRVNEIFLLGRRGPAQAAFTNPEIRELCEIPGWDLVVKPAEMELDEASRAFLAAQSEPTFRRNVEILNQQAAKGEGSQPNKIRARFLVSPVEIAGSGKVEALRLERNTLMAEPGGGARAKGTGQFETIPVNLVFRSIGYKGLAMPGLPFDAKAGVIPNRAGRVIDPASGQAVPRLYVAGWIKRGPSGVIGTNKNDAIESVRAMREDLAALTVNGVNPAPEAVLELLRGRDVRVVSYADWKRIDAAEVARGQPQGRPRVKFTAVPDMLRVLGE